MASTYAWIGFNIFVAAMLIVDLGVFHRDARPVRFREALAWSIVWIALALLFNVGLYYWAGKEAALQFFTGYLIERSLSVDNLFVFLMLFSYFRVPPNLQHKVLFWGIIAALLMRAAFIFAGVSLIERFHWLLYFFGGFLVFTGIRMGFHEDEEFDPEKNIAFRISRRFIPVTKDYRGDKFFVHEDGRFVATPLFMAFIIVNVTDFIFAMDSIPAIFAISSDAFIIYTSNAFAIFGLRALYFALAGMMEMFHYLKYGLSVILVFVGAKMLLDTVYPIPIGIALAVITVILSAAVAASLLWPSKTKSPSDAI